MKINFILLIIIGIILLGLGTSYFLLNSRARKSEEIPSLSAPTSSNPPVDTVTDEEEVVQ